jgi:hypothetical protein
MPRETPTIHFGDIARYQRSRKRSGLSRDALLAEQDKMEREIVKAAAKRGVKLKGAVADKRREDGRRAAAAAEGGKRKRAAAAAAGGKGKRAAAVSAAASVSSVASVSSADAAASAAPAAAAVSSRGRPLIAKRQWSLIECDD